MKTQVNYNIVDHNIVIDYEKRYVLQVKDLATEDKPRERLIKHGPGILSVSELLAIILGVGTRREEVATMSSRILKEYGEKNIINQKNPKALEKELNIPENKACQIVACFELGRRFFQKTDGGPIFIRTAKEAFEYLHEMRNLPKEQLRGLYLNSRYQLIHDEIISIGSLTANIVHPREIFKPAIEYSAAAIIIAHNHPSGDKNPTQSDIDTTKQISNAAQLLGIDLLDHIIIANDEFFSIMNS